MRRFFRKRLPAFLLTLVMVMTLVPAVSARSSADLTYEVDKGDSVSFNRAGVPRPLSEVNIVVTPSLCWYCHRLQRL